MSIEKKKNSLEQIGTLNSCLLDGDSEQKARERRIKRRALVISVVLQSVALVALVLVPLLGKTEKLQYTLFTPIPQYYHPAPRPIVERAPIVRHFRPTSGIYAPPSIPQTIATHDTPPPPDSVGPDSIDIGNTPAGPARPDGINIFDNRRGPAPPEDPDRNKKKRISVGGLVQQAMLIRRVEPSYPTLARQTRVSGQVHLRAIISTDGSIASLQVIDGHPLLVQSALDAVGQWRYKPTLLNGQAVEVETIITVIYSLGQQ